MTAAEPQHEPTMEEILASIRKIISEDQPEASEPDKAPVAAAEPEPAPVFDTEVLELTEEVTDDFVAPPAPVHTPPPPAPEPIDDDIEFQAADEVPEVPEQTMTADADDLISDRTRSAVERVLEGIDQDSSEVQRAAPPAGGGLDALFIHAIQSSFDPVLKEWVLSNQAEVFDRLNPLIRDWMDSNLPSLIEAAVQKEIARAVSARRR
jgi:cell pole-organizing protein PopZ